MMFANRKFYTATTAGILALAMLGTSVAPAVAAPVDSPQGSSAASSVDPQVTEREVEELSNNLEELFTNALEAQGDGNFVVNEAALAEHYGEDEAASILQALRGSGKSLGTNTPAAQSYGQCVLNFTGFGAIFGASEGTILGYINKKNWKKAAETMVKFLGKQAVKGGAVGLAASLAAAGAWCATPWGRG